MGRRPSSYRDPPFRELPSSAWEIASDTVRGDPTLNRMFGVPANAGDRPLGDYLRAIDPQQLCRVSNDIRKVVTPGGGDCYEQEYRLLADGQTRSVCARGFVRRDTDGNAVELVGVVLDITRQKAKAVSSARVLRASGLCAASIRSPWSVAHLVRTS